MKILNIIVIHIFALILIVTPIFVTNDLNKRIDCIEDVLDSVNEQIVYIEQEIQKEPFSRITDEELDSFTIYSELIRKACVLYDIKQVDRAVAIACLESGNFASKSFKVSHNFGGITRNGKVVCYEDDMSALSDYMNVLVAYDDMSIEEMQKKYCPANKNWGKLVEQLMKEINDEQTR